MCSHTHDAADVLLQQTIYCFFSQEDVATGCRMYFVLFVYYMSL